MRIYTREDAFCYRAVDGVISNFSEITRDIEVIRVSKANNTNMKLLIST